MSVSVGTVSPLAHSSQVCSAATMRRRVATRGSSRWTRSCCRRSLWATSEFRRASRYCSKGRRGALPGSFEDGVPACSRIQSDVEVAPGVVAATEPAAFAASLGGGVRPAGLVHRDSCRWRALPGGGPRARSTDLKVVLGPGDGPVRVEIVRRLQRPHAVARSRRVSASSPWNQVGIGQYPCCSGGTGVDEGNAWCSAGRRARPGRRPSRRPRASVALAAVDRLRQLGRSAAGVGAVENRPSYTPGRRSASLAMRRATRQISPRLRGWRPCTGSPVRVELSRSEYAYSMRRPEIARAITSCWISLVPSKIVWILASRCQRSTGYSRV